MGDTISSIVAGPKVFYAIGYSSHATTPSRWFVGKNTFGVQQPQDAMRFPTVAALFAEKRTAAWSSLSEFRIVKVTEVPGTETRRVLKETEGAVEGETVKYAITDLRDFAVDLSIPYARTGRWTTSIQEARLYDSSVAAVRAQAQGAKLVQDSFPPLASVVRVALSTTAPSFTEQVLS